MSLYKEQCLNSKIDEIEESFREKGLYSKLNPIDCASEACYYANCEAPDYRIADTLVLLKKAQIDALKKGNSPDSLTIRDIVLAQRLTKKALE